MGIIRGLGRGVGALLLLVLLAPIVALVPAAVLDRGPSGETRGTLFPAALTMFDPFFWTCAGQSLAVAALVAVGSLGLGEGLGRILGRWSFRGRDRLGLLMPAPWVFPPLISALGFRVLFGPTGPWHSGWVVFGVPLRLDPGWAPWVGWVWSGLIQGVPVVSARVAHDLARVDPTVEDAARQLGASPRQVWRRLVRPLIRPGSARGAATVFLLTLLEPGAPLVLGLRRTLAFQAVESAARPESLPRAAMIALFAVACVLLVQLGARLVPGVHDLDVSGPPVARRQRASWPRQASFQIVLTLGVVLTWLPALGVVALAFTPGPNDPVGGMRLTLAPIAAAAADPLIRRIALNSLVLGIAVVVLDLTLIRTSAASLALRRVLQALEKVMRFIPPLAVGVGAVALPEVLRLGAGSLAGTRGLPQALQWAGDLLDPYRTPGLLLALAVAAVQLPGLASRAAGSPDPRPVPADAALQLGATRAQARRLATPRRRLASPATLLTTLILAATNLTPALLLTPTAETRPALPALLILADTPGAGLERAAVLATFALALNLARHVPGKKSSTDDTH